MAADHGAPGAQALPGSVGHAGEEASFSQVSPDAGQIVQVLSPSNLSPPSNVAAPPLPRRKPPPPRQPQAQFLQPDPPMEHFSEDALVHEYTPQASEAGVSYISPGSENLYPDMWEEEEPVTLTRLEEFLAVQHGLKANCRTLPMTFILWITFTLLVFYHGQAKSSYENADSIRSAMQSISVPAPNATFRKVTLDTVTDYSDIMRWIQDGLIRTVTVPGLGHGRIGQSQDLMGLIKITQLRGAPAPCGLSDSLQRFYPGVCYPYGGIPVPFGMDDMDYAFKPAKGNPRRFTAWLDIGRNLSTLDERIQTLESGNWLDASTHDIVVEAAFFNRDMNVYSHLQIKFEMHRGGWIEQDLIVKPMRGDVYMSWGLIFLDLIWVFVMLGFIWNIGKSVLEEMHRGTLGLYVNDMWSYLDWLVVICGLLIGVSFYYLTMQLDKFSDLVNALGTMPQWAVSEAPAHYKTRAVIENIKFQGRVEDIFKEFRAINGQSIYVRLSGFWYSFLIVARFFRGFTGQPRIAVLLQTVMMSTEFLFHYLLVFVVVMASFTVGGYIVFGEQLQHWSTLGKATASAFLVLFGRFEYNEFHTVAPITAACWFFVFFITSALVLMGILTAAILNQYLKVRVCLGEPGESIVQQAHGLLREALFSRSYEGSLKTIPDDILFDTISEAKGTDPSRLRRLGRLRVDRRLRTRADVQQAQDDPPLDVDVLVGRGCDPNTAHRLIDRCREAGRKIDTLSSPSHRITVLLAKNMTQLRHYSDRMKRKSLQQTAWMWRTMDRLDLKHAKCGALARRIQRAQELPPGWTAHFDEQGQRYLRNEESGLTSWTLPRHLI